MVFFGFVYWSILFKGFVRRKGQYWPLNQEMAFLLLDNPKEACDCIKNMIEIKQRHFGLEFQLLMLNGSKKNIRQWHVKFLSALFVCVGSLAKTFQIPISNIMPEDLSVKNEVEGEFEGRMINEFSMLCLKIKNNEKQILSPFRLKLFQTFSSNSIEVLHILRRLHLTFYGKAIDGTLEEEIQQKSASPLTIILQFMADGHLCDTGNEKDIDRLVTAYSLVDRTIIKDREFQTNDEGVYVKRGECIIINQIYKNNQKYYRKGTEKDETELIRTWEKLGCKNNITVERDLTRDQMINALTKFRLKLKKSLPDFMAIIILSHGKRDAKTGAEYIMDVNMNGMLISKIKNMFIDGHKCPSMIGRPKMFFIQACRGIKNNSPQDTWLR